MRRGLPDAAGHYGRHGRGARHRPALRRRPGPVGVVGCSSAPVRGHGLGRPRLRRSRQRASESASDPESAVAASAPRTPAGPPRTTCSADPGALPWAPGPEPLAPRPPPESGRLVDELRRACLGRKASRISASPGCPAVQAAAPGGAGLAAGAGRVVTQLRRGCVRGAARHFRRWRPAVRVRPRSRRFVVRAATAAA